MTKCIRRFIASRGKCVVSTSRGTARRDWQSKLSVCDLQGAFSVRYCRVLKTIDGSHWTWSIVPCQLQSTVSLLHKQLCLEPHSSCCASSLQSPLDVSTRRGSAQSPSPRHLALKPKCKCKPKEAFRTSVSLAMAEMTEYLLRMYYALCSSRL